MMDSQRYSTAMQGRLCELAFRLCEDHDVQILDPNKKEPIYLTCSEKIRYCQLALDSLHNADQDASVSFSQPAAAQRLGSDTSRQHSAKLEHLISHFRYQLIIIKEMDAKLAAAEASDQKDQLKTARDTLDITFIDKIKLE